jgi:isopentenyl diphosphate isomerase/L-lactate dehydrogenase-like FMN-dependent dehydrogenase
VPPSKTQNTRTKSSVTLPESPSESERKSLKAASGDQHINLIEWEEKARAVLPTMAYDYYASGATDEITLQRNRQVYSEILLRPKMLCDVSYRDLSVKLLGQTIAMPILVAPTAFQGLAHQEAELATARAARSLNTIMTVSTLANSSLEEVAAQAPEHLWFQLYVYKDREITKELVGRAAAAGYKALVVTVDSPILGKRERDLRNGFHLPAHLSAKNLSGQGLDEIGSSEKNSGLAAYIASLYDTALTWEMLDWIMSIAKLPVLVKGILRGEDAREAMARGAAGVIVSNHGGRQIDTTVSTIDVLKALALGAKAVLVGRPILWALATGGEAGVKECLTILKQELDLTMALSGCATLAEITPDLLKLPLHMK